MKESHYKAVFDANNDVKALRVSCSFFCVPSDQLSFKATLTGSLKLVFTYGLVVHVLRYDNGIII